MKSIIVTGGAGYAGLTITQRLAEEYPDYKIIIFDRNQRACNELAPILKNKFNNIEIFPHDKADIRNEKIIEDVIKTYQPEIVVNLAAKVTNFSKDEAGKNEECMATNFEAPVKMAKIAKTNGVKTFIQQSSVSVYEPSENMKENSPTNPLSVYGKSKLFGEKEILSLKDEAFNVIVFRAATVVGYNINFKYETMLNLMCIRSVLKIPFSIFESALYNDKTYLDIEDNARAIIFAIDNSKKLSGEIFNLTSFNANLDSVLKIITKELDGPFPYTIIKEEKKNKQVYTVNSDKLKSFGFEPKGLLDEILIKTISSLKSKRDFDHNSTFN